jgi:hypothetical protein
MTLSETSAAVAPATRQSILEEYNEKAVQEIMSMGFGRAQTEAAMRGNFNNPGQAALFLVSCSMPNTKREKTSGHHENISNDLSRRAFPEAETFDCKMEAILRRQLSSLNNFNQNVKRLLPTNVNNRISFNELNLHAKKDNPIMDYDDPILKFAFCLIILLLFFLKSQFNI